METQKCAKFIPTEDVCTAAAKDELLESSMHLSNENSLSDIVEKCSLYHNTSCTSSGIRSVDNVEQQENETHKRNEITQLSCDSVDYRPTAMYTASASARMLSHEMQMLGNRTSAIPRYLSLIKTPQTGSASKKGHTGDLQLYSNVPADGVQIADNRSSFNSGHTANLKETSHSDQENNLAKDNALAEKLNTLSLYDAPANGQCTRTTSAKERTAASVMSRSIASDESKSSSGAAKHPTPRREANLSASRSSSAAAIKDGQRLSWSAQSKIGSLDNAQHKPGGGDVKIENKRLSWNSESKIGSLKNASHQPGGGDKKIESHRLSWSAQSKIGSLENAAHKPGGGEAQIHSEKLTWEVSSRIGSLENAGHKPAGGDVKIETRKLSFKEKAKARIGSLDNANHTPSGGNVKIEEHKLDFKETAHSKIGSLDNVSHTPRGGDKKIETVKLDFKEKAQPKIGSLEKAGYQPSGGNKQIFTEKLNFKETAQPKVGSKDNIHHVPGGGDKKIEYQVVSPRYDLFPEKAKPKQRGSSEGSIRRSSTSSNNSKASNNSANSLDKNRNMHSPQADVFRASPQEGEPVATYQTSPLPSDPL